MSGKRHLTVGVASGGLSSDDMVLFYPSRCSVTTLQRAIDDFAAAMTISLACQG
jgi:hypothetical protein